MMDNFCFDKLVKTPETTLAVQRFKLIKNTE